MLTRAALIVALASTLLMIASCQSTEPPRLQFALIGDNPYQDFNEPKYERMINRINDHGGLSFVVHVGDLKASTITCSNEVFQSLFELNQQFKIPFILTPGDNDWFDCKRESAGGWDRRERLARFRDVFYPTPGVTGGQPRQVTTQALSPGFPAFVENVYWQEQGVIFATLHIVGLTMQEGGLDIHAELMDAALAWLDVVFDAARQQHARGVFLATQTDPYLFTTARGLLKFLCADCPFVRPGYEALNEALLGHAENFLNPIVLAVGDTHIFRVDKPLYNGDHLVEHFTRVETFGDPNVHWVRVVVNPQANQLFEFHQEIIPENRGAGWNPMDRE